MFDIGLCGTEEVYWGTSEYQVCGGIITASHNPKNYNGLKMLQSLRPLDQDHEFSMIKKLAEGDNFKSYKPGGNSIDIKEV